MKRNVDLTQGMTFSNNRTGREILNLRDLLIEKDYPWDTGKNIFAPIEKSLVLVGDKNSRRYIKNNRQYESAELGCDRCGVDISRKPWNKYGYLCDKCDEKLEDDANNIKQPWQYKHSK